MPLFQVGDVIESLGGTSVADLIAQWTPYYAVSNQAARLRDIAQNMTRGNCGPVNVMLRRANKTIAITSSRLAGGLINLTAGATHDRPGPTLQKLSDEVAYLKLSSVKAADSSLYVRAASGTKGVVIDIRNYPSEFVVFTLGSLLATRPAPFARFTQPLLDNPGAFVSGQPVPLNPVQPHYSGRIVILVDEITQSQAEYTTMAFRVSPDAVVVGSTAAGADRNVSPIPLPGGLSTMISGLGVFYPDGTPTQRVGIIPDVRAVPTVDGIRAGRDEVLEAGIRQILGKDASQSDIESMARIPGPQ